jgi:hypothetical protein
MLIAKCTVKPSSIAGVGLFADQDIEKGQIVWHYTPETCVIFTRAVFDTLVASHHKTESFLIKYILTYSYYVETFNGLVLCLDNARFVNHCSKPNMWGGTSGGQYSIALRDIKQGEELTENYASYDSNPWLDEQCQRFNIDHTSYEDAIECKAKTH